MIWRLTVVISQLPWARASALSAAGKALKRKVRDISR
jgi:hypothetical protein